MPTNPKTPAPKRAGGTTSTTPATKQRSLLSFFKPPSALANGVNRTAVTTLEKVEKPSERQEDDGEPELPTPRANNLIKKLSLSNSNEYREPPVEPSSPGIEDTPSVTGRRRLKRASELLASESDPVRDISLVMGSSPSARLSKRVNYAESSDENDEVVAVKRRKTNSNTVDDEEDEFQFDVNLEDLDENMDDFIVPDDEDEDDRPTKKKSNPNPKPATKNPEPKKNAVQDKYAFRPKANDERPVKALPKRDIVQTLSTLKKTMPLSSSAKKLAEERYQWLVDIRDADKNPPNHPDYDPRTLYIPPSAWNKFSPFERQYWEIKSKNWDTVVFFRKGKFYELYENDATIGYQQFDLKVTDRVNMRMVGMPCTSFNTWATQFIAKGYKVARVDQNETALGKEMREKGIGGASKDDKIIKRELACILTGGTLVDEVMLQDEMSVYCVAIKESETGDGLPAFGIAFVDTATGSFQLSEFVDDLDMSKFETFVAQIRPKELIVEKGNVSTKVMRILKNNTSITTIWNKLKPGKEFLEADIAIREIIANEYFSDESPEDVEKWPEAIREAKDKELVISALGALLYYLQSLKIDKDLVGMGNFSWYDPIKKATSLVLDGQTLQNLEVFANSFDGGTEGTLFSLLNRCITPFGKRLFRQWLCHPLADADRINARLDAVDALLADDEFREAFVSQLGKLPDLERLISRVHAGHCRAQDFLRVLEGFEQVRDTVISLAQYGEGDGLIGQILKNMPDLDTALKHWETAFDRYKARDEGILVPEQGVEADFDENQDLIESIIDQLRTHLKKYQREYKCKEICFKDVGKEIYTVEVPTNIKGVPKGWAQMSGTQKVKRYWPPEIKKLVRHLQEAQETHSQILKDIAGRFYKRFDEDYNSYLGAIKVISQLDCLTSLSKASAALGEPCCRPKFINSERTVVNFEELRHPCILTTGDFIPNDVTLGGDTSKITLLTGANAAGKSTVLRMTCIAVMMAQLGCYAPARSAMLTPLDRIMSRLGANDNIFASQSTFFVELSETKKILSEASTRSLVILDELGRGTSSYDGVAVAQSVLHHLATHIGCVGFFATHYHSLAPEFASHPEINPQRMAIHVDDENRNITFLYKLEPGVAEGSFGMHCASMCGISSRIVDRAEQAAKEFEHTSKLKESLERARAGTKGDGCYIPLGWQSDFAWLVRQNNDENSSCEKSRFSLEGAVEGLLHAVDYL